MGSKSADKMLEIIRGVIRSELEREDAVEMCEVRRVDDDGGCEVSLLSDPDLRTVRARNATALTLAEGDRAYLYKVGGKLSNSFIFAKPLPYAASSAPASGFRLDAAAVEILARLGYTILGTTEGLMDLSDGTDALGATTR